MLRLRFSSGLILGLVVGVPTGVLLGVLMLPPRGGDSTAATNLQVIELTRKLEAANDAKERTDRQLEQFQKLADQMTTTFKSLEQRFNTLEEAARLHDAARQAGAPPEAKAPPPPTVPPAPTVTPAVPASPSPQAAGAAPGSPLGEPQGEPEDSTDTGG